MRNQSAGRGFSAGPFEPDPDLDLPENPTIDQQIAAGKQQLTRLEKEDRTLDRDQDFSTYMKEIVAELLAAQKMKPPIPSRYTLAREEKQPAFPYTKLPRERLIDLFHKRNARKKT